MTDKDLLHEYLEYTSDKAFTDLVQRHIDLVYWTCHRDAGDARLAETATQDVFSLLAHKAGSIHEGGSVVDWLFERSRMATKNVLIREMRDGQTKLGTGDDAWKRIEPLINDSIAGLSEMDREALLLRIFEDRGPDEVSAEIGATEEAVSTRVAHAVTSMGLQLEKRGATVAGDKLAGLLKESGAPYASIKVEAIVETALRATPVAEKPAPKPVSTPTSATPPAGRRRNAPLIAAVATIAVLAIGGLVALKLQSTQPAVKPSTAPVASSTTPALSPSTADAAPQPASGGDPFAPKPDSATGSVPLASTTPPATAPVAKPTNPGTRDVPTDANGLIVGPGQPNGRVPVLPSTAPTLPSPTVQPAVVQPPPIARAHQERLMGVVTGAQPSAVMEIDGREQIVSVGATVDGGKVTEIADDHVTITSPDGQSRMIPLATSR